jgi:2-dehydropantoate 2-reductase
MRIAVFGVGGVGGYFGGRLTQTDHEVSFIARGRHLAAIRKNGLRIESENGDVIAEPAQATDNAADIGEVDVVIVATKAWQVREAAEAMRSLIGTQTAVVPLLNGVEAPSQIAAVLGEEHALGGFCRVLSHVEAPGHIIQGGTPPFVAFGELDNRDSERVRALRQAFQAAGVTVQEPPDILAAMWQKLLFIASFSGVGAVTRAPAGVMRSVAPVHAMVRAAMDEVFHVARTRNIPLADDAVEKGMALFDSLPEGGIASMQRDVMEGRPSELDAQSGAVVRLGDEVGVEVPLHRFLYHSLLPAEMTARGEL